MLTGLNYKNLRSEERLFTDLPQHAILSGRNGAGKSSFKEALSFLFAGMTSDGSRNPRFLALDPNSPIEVGGVTRKGAVITRTLSPTGTQKLVMTRAGVPQTMTQKEFEALLGCSSEVMLAVMVPGYFLSKVHKGQSDILAEISPPVSRLELLEQLYGKELPEPFRATAISAKSDMVLSNQITEARRALDKQIAQSQGAFETLKRQLEEKRAAAKPIIRPSQTRLFELEELRKQWDTYKATCAARDKQLADIEQIKAKIEELTASWKAIQEKKKELGQVESAESERAVLRKLREMTLVAPPPFQGPPLFNVIDEENCPTCGQVVGQKHKESMRAKNKAIKDEWQEKEAEYYNVTLHEFEKKKKAREADIEAAEALLKQAESNERLLATWNNQQISIAAEGKILKTRLENTASEEPVPPLHALDEDAYRIELAAYTEASKAQAVFETTIVEMESIEKSMKAHIASQAGWLDSQKTLVKLEEVMKALPGKKLEAAKSGFELPAPFKAIVGETSIEITDERGTPYALMSSGERIKAAISVSLTLNKMMKRSLNVLFIEDSDLCDDTGAIFEENPRVQIFAMKVDACSELVLLDYDS